MQILGCKAIPIVRMRMTISRISMAGKDGVEIIEKSDGKSTTIWVPRSVAKHLSVGNTIEALCAISPDLKHGWEVYVLAIRVDVMFIKHIYAKSPLWEKQFSSLVF